MRVSTSTGVMMMLFGFTIAAGARSWEYNLRDQTDAQIDTYIQTHASEVKATDFPALRRSYLAKTLPQRIALDVLAVGGLIWAGWSVSLLRKNRSALDD